MIRLSPEARSFVTERHLATLSTLRPDGSIHTVPVAFWWDSESGKAAFFTRGSSVKVRNIETLGGTARGTLCQVDGGRWLTFEGTLEVVRDPEAIAAAVPDHARRFGRTVAEDQRRVLVRLTATRVMGSQFMVS